MTREEAKNECGICLECKEWTSLVESCCGAGVSFEGSTYFEEDFEEEK